MRGALPEAFAPRSFVVLATVATCAWFEAGMRPFTVGATTVTFSAAAAVVALGAFSSRGGGLLPGGVEARSARTGATGLGRRGSFAWALAVAFAVAVELWELFHLPRSYYPTLSSLANAVIGPGHRVGRALAFVCWALCGLVLSALSSAAGVNDALWLVAAGGLCACEAAARLADHGWPTAARLVGGARTNAWSRAALVLGWLWLGWHVFAR